MITARIIHHLHSLKTLENSKENFYNHLIKALNEMKGNLLFSLKETYLQFQFKNRHQKVKFVSLSPIPVDWFVGRYFPSDKY